MASLLVCVALAVGADALRQQRRPTPQVKYIAGVPIYNYDQAYEGQHSLLGEGAELEENWIVMANDHASDEVITALCTSSTCKDVGNPSEGGVPFFEVRCSEAELEKIILQGDGMVDFVEPDLPVYALEEEVELESEESQEESQAATWGLNKIGADKRPNRGKGVNIFILDTGVRTTHNEFGNRARPALDFSPSGKRTECKGSKSCAVDRQGHGTHCAGTAAGKRYGVAPHANIFSAKVLGDDGKGSSSWGIGSLDWIASKKGKAPTVASMSLGGRGTSSSYDNAIRKVTGRGVVVVVAAGNDKTDACGFTPAHVSTAITVGSTDSQDYRSSFSNYGKCVNIWAPGSNIWSAYLSSNDATKSLSGTSMACPHVAGAAAIVLSSSRGSSPSAVRKQLLSRAKSGRIRGLTNSDTNRLLYVGR